MKTYYFADGVMRNYIKQEDIILDWNGFIDIETQQKLYELLQKRFSQKRNTGIKDTVIYNFIRNKNLFNGISKLRQNKFESIEFDFSYDERFKYSSDYDMGKEITTLIGDNGAIQYNKILKIISAAFKAHFERDTTELKFF